MLNAYLQELKHIASRLPDIRTQHIAIQFYENARPEINNYWTEHGYDGELTSLDVLLTAGLRCERAILNRSRRLEESLRDEQDAIRSNMRPNRQFHRDRLRDDGCEYQLYPHLNNTPAGESVNCHNTRQRPAQYNMPDTYHANSMERSLHPTRSSLDVRHSIMDPLSDLESCTDSETSQDFRVGAASISQCSCINRTAAKARQADRVVPKTYEVEVRVNGHLCHALLDTGSHGDLFRLH